MFCGETMSSRRLSVTIPDTVQGPYCSRRPTLREILSNRSEAPWTLAAFTAYLSSNHCLETLEFTMDASRYRKHYAQVMAHSPLSTKDQDTLKELWRRLVEAYIKPSGSREVNLPSDVKAPILHYPLDGAPPPPEVLGHAVAKIYELMEESVLASFLNSVYPQSPTFINESVESVHDRSYEDRSGYVRRVYDRRSTPSPPTTHAELRVVHSHPSSVPRSHGPTAPSHPQHRNSGNGGTRPHHRLVYHPTSHSQSSDRRSHSPSDIYLSGSGGSVGAAMSDDSGSIPSPTFESPATQFTPVSSPPTSNPPGSPKRDSGMWRKLGRLSGMKPVRKRSESGLREEG